MVQTPGGRIAAVPSLTWRAGGSDGACLTLTWNWNRRGGGGEREKRLEVEGGSVAFGCFPRVPDSPWPVPLEPRF